jgi:uncharacterized protein (TIGR03790 family)
MRRLLLLSVVALLSASPALAQSGANVLLVVNEAVPDSARIASHYSRVRSVPPEQVLRVKLEAADEIERAAFIAQLQAPIVTWLQQHAAQDRILYIVLTKGIPLRIRGTTGRSGTAASVDSELTLLYQRLVGLAPAVDGRVANPYFLGTAPVAEARRFSREAFDLYLVLRLDGYTVEDVTGLIDRGAAPAPEGRILLDQKTGTAGGAADAWLTQAADLLLKTGFDKRVVLETSGGALTGLKDVLGYYSWGSNDPAITTRRSGFAFVPGAIAASYVSTDARTFTEPPAAWTIGKWTDRTTFYAGSPQSLAGDLIREGVTGVAAHVEEPFLDASIRPDILFPAYVSGLNLAESYYLAMPYLSWQTVVVGDPLCAPFPRRALQPEDIDKGIDPVTELPALFAARRLAVLTRTTTPEAAKAVLRSEAKTAGSDKAGAQAALEEATALDSKLVSAHLVLASEYESQKAYDKEIARYRQVLAASPDHIIALNNLAYALAVRKGETAEAIGFAERAMRLSGGRSPEIADTLAWVQHLLGRDREAADILGRIVKAVPERAVFRLHAAVVLAAIDRFEEAATELREAVRLDPDLEKSDEAKALRAKLGR